MSSNEPKPEPKPIDSQIEQITLGPVERLRDIDVFNALLARLAYSNIGVNPEFHAQPVLMRQVEFVEDETAMEMVD